MDARRRLGAFFGLAVLIMMIYNMHRFICARLARLSDRVFRGKSEKIRENFRRGEQVSIIYVNTEENNRARPFFFLYAYPVNEYRCNYQAFLQIAILIIFIPLYIF